MAGLNSIYTFLWQAHGDEFAVLDESLSPRSWEFIFELGAGIIERDSLVVDAGCGRGIHCREMVRRFGCRAIGFDLAYSSLRAADPEPAADERVLLIQASIGQIPLPDACADLVWCRDMLVHVEDLDGAMRECSRILRTAGKMLLYTTLETDLMEPREAARIYAALAIHPLRREGLERAFDRAGLRIERSELIGGELIEYYQEREGRAIRDLMRLARMHRTKERWVAEWGQARCDTLLALYHWMIYLLLGKLTGAYFIVEKI